MGLDLPWQLDRGFETWELRNRSARFVVAEALRWVDEDPDPPFFLFLNLRDFHHPVNPSTQFALQRHRDAPEPATEGAPPTFTPEQLEMLEALGYR